MREKALEGAGNKLEAMLQLYRDGKARLLLFPISPPGLLTPFVARSAKGMIGWVVEPRLDFAVTVEPKPCLRLVLSALDPPQILPMNWLEKALACVPYTHQVKNGWA